jgi:hypothetical protein
VDDLERDVAEHLRTLPPHDPPPGLADRILTRTAARRRRRRAVAAIAALATCGATAVTVASLRHDPAPVAGQAALTIQRVLPGGQRFKAMALNPDGTVLGAAISIGPDGATTPADGVWTAGPSAPAPRRIQHVAAASLPYLWTMATGDRTQVWPEGERLKCLDQNGAVHDLGAGWTGRERFYAERGLVVWGDSGNGVAVASSCDGPRRTVPVKGTLGAFSYPDAFVAEDGGTTWQVDVRSGTQSAVPRVPGSAVEMAAGPTALAWLKTDATLTIRDRTTGRDTTAAALPAGQEQSIQLTIGRNVVVYSGLSQDTDTGLSRVYDLRTGASTDENGAALAAGDWLLLQAGDTYRLTRR